MAEEWLIREYGSAKALWLVEKLSGEIVQSWIDYFVLNKKVVAKKIAGKL